MWRAFGRSKRGLKVEADALRPGRSDILQEMQLQKGSRVTFYVYAPRFLAVERVLV